MTTTTRWLLGTLGASALLFAGCGQASGGTMDGGTPSDAFAGGDGPRDAPLSDAGPRDDASIDAFVRDLGVSDDATPDGFTIDTSRDAGVRVPVNHRPNDSACQTSAPAGNCSFGGGAGACSMDSDCTAGTNGRCNMNLGGAAFCRCTYDACVHDTDCPTDQTCACHGSALYADGNACFPGNCRVDSDCGASGFCSPSIAPSGCGGLGGYYCHTAADACTDDADCSGSGLMACEYVAASSRWECVGRLFCP